MPLPSTIPSVIKSFRHSVKYYLCLDRNAKQPLCQIVTGSFDKTAKLWDANTGQPDAKFGPSSLGCRDFFYSQTLACSQCSCNILKQVARCIHTLKGHHTEIVCVAFNVQARQELLHLLLQAQIRWRSQGTHVATGSMDNTAKLWDVFSSERSLYQDLGETESRERRDMAGVRVKLFPCKVETGHQIASLEGHSVMLSENYPSCFVSLAFLRPR